MCRDLRARAKKIFASQGGFTLVEVLIVVTMIGILASVAVPRFTSSLELANTAKVQADLQTLDAAIVMYEAEKGTTPNSIDDLAEYVNDLPTPPKGKCRLKSTGTHEIVATQYAIKEETVGTGGLKQKRAACDDHVAGDFGS